MDYTLAKQNCINVLASEADWPWPSAIERIFRPRGINLLVARTANEFINVIEHVRIHTTIVDMDCRNCGGFAIIKAIRMANPTLPCLVMTKLDSDVILDEALRMEVFSVIAKPVDLDILHEQLNRLFMKKYNSNIFAV